MDKKPHKIETLVTVLVLAIILGFMYFIVSPKPPHVPEKSIQISQDEIINGQVKEVLAGYNPSKALSVEEQKKQEKQVLRGYNN